MFNQWSFRKRTGAMSAVVFAMILIFSVIAYSTIQFTLNKTLNISNFHRPIDQSLNKIILNLKTLQSQNSNADIKTKAQQQLSEEVKKLSTYDTKIKLNADDLVKLESSILQLQIQYQNLYTSEVNETQSVLRNTLFYLVAITFIFGVGSLFIGYFLTRFLSYKLNKISNKLTQGAVDLEFASKRIAETGTELAASTHEQAAALQETAAAIEQVNMMIRKNSESSEKSKLVATKSQQTAIRGKESVESMIHSINEMSLSQDKILHEVEDSNKRISEIVKLISEIESKTKIINEIVFQTKILSFNASVEAARAGENGKGFAVVAQEVGNLAQMSGNSAQEISVLLSDSIAKVNNIISTTSANVGNLITDGRDKVKQGEEVAKICGQVLTEVVNDVHSVNEIMNEISQASSEQAIGIAEINKAIQNLDKATHENSKASEVTSVGAENLYVQAGDLRLTVDEMRKFVSGSALERRKRNKAPMKAPMPAPTKVIDIKAKLAQKKDLLKKGPPTAPIPVASTPRPAKKVVAGTDIPLESDPRFEDI